jgi:hypothetical protein
MNTESGLRLRKWGTDEQKKSVCEVLWLLLLLLLLLNFYWLPFLLSYRSIAILNVVLHFTVWQVTNEMLRVTVFGFKIRKSLEA